MSGLQTSTTVSFNDGAGRRLTLETDSDVSLPKIKGTSYTRVFPSFAAPSITAVMGTATRLASSIPLEVVDYVSFSNSDSSSLQYYPGTAVIIESARFFQASPVVVYDSGSNSLILDKACHGIVKVTYTTYYDRYKVEHGDAPCKAASVETKGDGTTGNKQANYDPAFLVATASGWESASQEISGPPCNQGDEGLNRTVQFSDYDPVGIKLEVDAAMPAGLYPQYFTADNAPMGFTLQPQVVFLGGMPIELFCGCRIRVYPKAGVTLRGVNCAVGMQVVGQGTKPVLEALTFSNSQSTNLQYPPSSEVSLYSTSINAISTFGDGISVQFIGPGGWCNEVVWKSRTTYEMVKGARKVNTDEVVVATAIGSNTIPCTTFCQAEYTSDYYLYDVLFNFDTKTGWYAPAMILAYDSSGKMGSLSIEPPPKGGVL